MSRQEALRNDLKALEWLRDLLRAQHPAPPQSGAEGQAKLDSAVLDLDRVHDAEYSDPRKVFRN